MSAKDLGTKHICWKCSTKYYDLKKVDPVCPKCGADPRQAPVVKAPTAAERRKAAAVKAVPVEEVPEVVEEAEVEEDLAEDADDDAEEEAGEEEK